MCRNLAPQYYETSWLLIFLSKAAGIANSPRLYST